jgi:hypothetical protein
VQKAANERGMTLIVVLLVMTVFTIIGLSVIGASLSNMKQVTKTDADVKSTDIAEMGILYYESQLKKFLDDQLVHQETQKELLKRLFAGTADKNDLLRSFRAKFPIELNRLFTSNPYLYSADQFIQETLVDLDHSFKIKVNPYGILDTVCPSSAPSDSQCFTINFDSYAYEKEQLQKKISGTYSFSYSVNLDSVEIKPGGPSSVPSYQKIIDSVQGSRLMPCKPSDFGKNYTTVSCISDLEPADIPNTKGISYSTIIFNKGVNLEHLSHAVSNSKLIIYSTDKNNPIRIGKFNPNGFINSDIVVIGNAKLFNVINKPEKSSIYITGNADLTGFELKNADSITKVCIQGTITPVSMINIKGIYSSHHNPTAYQQNCTETSKSVGDKTLIIIKDIISTKIDEKSMVTY